MGMEYYNPNGEMILASKPELVKIFHFKLRIIGSISIGVVANYCIYNHNMTIYPFYYNRMYISITI